MIKAYALREIGTGLYLPAGVTGKMQTEKEFKSKDKPRIFYTTSAAKNALAAWKLGHWTFGRPSGPTTKWEKDLISRRAATQVEIVTFFLEEERRLF